MYLRTQSASLPQRRRRMGRFGDSTGLPNPVYAGGFATSLVNLENLFSPATPNSSFSDWLYNATTGRVSPAQQATLVQQEQASLVKAGMDPVDAVAQSQQDVAETIATFPGAPASPSDSGLNWWLIGGIGIGLLLLLRR